MQEDPMTIAADVRLPIALIGLTMALGGCVVGTGYLTVPDRLPPKALPPMTRPLRFDVCRSPDQPPLRPEVEETRRKVSGDTYRGELAKAGVAGELTSVAGSPVDFTVTYSEELGNMGSLVISLVTFSIVPGYAAERRTLEVDLAWRDAAQVEKTELLRYQARTNLLIWLPLIVVPDFWMSLGDGWQSRKLEDGGFKQLVGRLGDDLRMRLGGSDVGPPLVGVVCPKPTRPAAGPIMRPLNHWPRPR
jgi:hypothetical protein